MHTKLVKQMNSTGLDKNNMDSEGQRISCGSSVATPTMYVQDGRATFLLCQPCVVYYVHSAAPSGSSSWPGTPSFSPLHHAFPLVCDPDSLASGVLVLHTLLLVQQSAQQQVVLKTQLSLKSKAQLRNLRCLLIMLESGHHQQVKQHAVCLQFLLWSVVPNQFVIRQTTSL